MRLFKSSWNPKKSDYSNWKAACAMPDVDGGKLPYKNPDGSINKQGVQSAMKMIGNVKGASEAQKKKAAKKLISAAKSVGVSPTPKVLELAGQSANKYADVEGSFDWIRTRLQTALRTNNPISSDENSYYEYFWIKDVFDDRVIIEEESSGKLYEVPWSMDGEGNVTFGTASEVKMDYVLKMREDDVSSHTGAVIEGQIVFKNDEEQTAYAAVLVPGEEDSDGDTVTAAQSRKVAHKFMDYRYHDLMHEVGDPVATTRESWLAQEPVIKTFSDGTEIEYPTDTWFMGVGVNDDYWPAVKSGELSGFSIMAVLESELASLKAANKSQEEIEAAYKKVTLKDLEEEGEWIVPAVSLVDTPAVGGSKWFALKRYERPGFFQRVFGGASKIEGPKEEEVDNSDEEKSDLSEILGLASSKTGAEHIPQTENDQEEEKMALSKEAQELVDAMSASIKSANEDLLKRTGAIEPEKSPEERIAEATAAAVSKAMEPVVERLEKLESGDAAEKSADEMSREELLERVKRLEQGSASSKSLLSDEDEDEDELDEDYDSTMGDEGRDVVTGARLRTAGEVE